MKAQIAFACVAFGASAASANFMVNPGFDADVSGWSGGGWASPAENFAPTNDPDVSGGFAFISTGFGTDPQNPTGEFRVGTSTATYDGTTDWVFSIVVTDGGQSTGNDAFALQFGYLEDESLGLDESNFVTLKIGDTEVATDDDWKPFSLTLLASEQTPDVLGKTIYAGFFTNIEVDQPGSEFVDASPDGKTDLWFDNASLTPTPGAAALLAVGGLAAARRRRA